MITIQQIDQLLETKLAKFENRIVKSLTNSINDTSGVIKQILPSSAVPSSSAVLPFSAVPSSPAVNLSPIVLWLRAKT